MRSPVLLVALALLAGCDTSPGHATAQDGTVTNAAERSLGAVGHARGVLARLAPAEALREV